MTTDNRTAAPWWRHPMMWLVVGGPAVVVVASFVTLSLAIRHPDPALHADESVAQRVPAEDAGQTHLQPAMVARNHAATAGR